MRATVIRMSAVATMALVAGLIAAPVSADDKPTARLSPQLQDLSAGRAPQPMPGFRPESGILTRPSGRVLVDVRLSNTRESTLDALRATGARIRTVDRGQRTVTVAIVPGEVGQLQRMGPAFEYAEEVLRPQTNAAACPSGPFVSEGLQQLNAALARTDFSVTGRGVTVGVLSDSYDFLGGAATDVGDGELPGTGNPCRHSTPVQVLEEHDGGIDEGRAMAQIIHDIAPDAKIMYSTAFAGELDFAQQIRDLANQGADIIVDDVTYFDEPFYQDGVVAKAVADVTAQGVAYFSSAANSNLFVGGKSVASYEAQSYRPTTCPASVVNTYSPHAVTCHDFDPGAGKDATYNFTVANKLVYTLGWNEPEHGVTTDLDLCLVKQDGTVAGCTSTRNLVSQTAVEFSSWNITGTPSASWVIVRYNASGTPRLKMISHRSGLTAVEWNTGTGGDVVGPTIFGHNASRPGASVAAVPFDNSGVVESYSSRGPATYCWGPVDGTNPAGAISPCQQANVDMAATDGGQNSFFGQGSPPRFYGTSAAAPHAAGVAALLLDREQCLQPAFTIAFLRGSGRPVGTATENDMGGGLIDAVDALDTAGVVTCDTSPPKITLTMPKVPASGWYTTAPVAGDVVAEDHRTVKTLQCSSATVSSLAGLGMPRATGKVTATGDGGHTVICEGKDAENNSGAASGSKNTATVRIDTTAPSLLCEALTLQAGSSGIVTAKVSDATSGPATPTASVPVTAGTPGSFTVSVSGADVAGNTAVVSCPYTVVAAPPPATPSISGPAKVKVGKRTFTASGLPANTSTRWTVVRKGRTVFSKNRTSDASGASVAKLQFAKKGRYDVRVVAGTASVSKKVRVR